MVENNYPSIGELIRHLGDAINAYMDLRQDIAIKNARSINEMDTILAIIPEYDLGDILYDAGDDQDKLYAEIDRIRIAYNRLVDHRSNIYDLMESRIKEMTGDKYELVMKEVDDDSGYDKYNRYHEWLNKLFDSIISEKDAIEDIREINELRNSLHAKFGYYDRTKRGTKK